MTTAGKEHKQSPRAIALVLLWLLSFDSDGQETKLGRKRAGSWLLSLCSEIFNGSTPHQLGIMAVTLERRNPQQFFSFLLLNRPGSF